MLARLCVFILPLCLLGAQTTAASSSPSHAAYHSHLQIANQPAPNRSQPALLSQYAVASYGQVSSYHAPASNAATNYAPPSASHFAQPTADESDPLSALVSRSRARKTSALSAAYPLNATAGYHYPTGAAPSNTHSASQTAHSNAPPASLSFRYPLPYQSSHGSSPTNQQPTPHTHSLNQASTLAALQQHEQQQQQHAQHAQQQQQLARQQLLYQSHQQPPLHQPHAQQRVSGQLPTAYAQLPAFFASPPTAASVPGVVAAGLPSMHAAAPAASHGAQYASSTQQFRTAVGAQVQPPQFHVSQLYQYTQQTQHPHIDRR